MTRSQLIQTIAVRCGLPHAVATQVVAIFFEAMAEALCQGRRIEIRGLGTFKVKRHAARSAHNPRTGDPVDVTSKVRPAYRMGKELRERLNEGLYEGPTTPHDMEWEE